MKPNTLVFLITATVLAVTHYLSLELHLYWIYLWWDIPMHFLGGTTVALGCFFLWDLLSKSPSQRVQLTLTFTAVLVVAIMWELFEKSIGVEFDQERYVIDTISDLIMGTLGGLFGYVIGSRLQHL